MCVAGGRDGAFRMQRHCSPYSGWDSQRVGYREAMDGRVYVSSIGEAGWDNRVDGWRKRDVPSFDGAESDVADGVTWYILQLACGCGLVGLFRDGCSNSTSESARLFLGRLIESWPLMISRRPSRPQVGYKCGVSRSLTRSDSPLKPLTMEVAGMGRRAGPGTRSRRWGRRTALGEASGNLSAA